MLYGDDEDPLSLYDAPFVARLTEASDASGEWRYGFREQLVAAGGAYADDDAGRRGSASLGYAVDLLGREVTPGGLYWMRFRSMAGGAPAFEFDGSAPVGGSAVHHDNVTVVFNDSFAEHYDSYAYHEGVDWVCVDSYWSWRNLTINLEGDDSSESTSILIGPDVYLYVGGPGILQVNAPLEVCGWLYWCHTTYTVASSTLTDWALPATAGAGEKVVFRMDAAADFEVLSIQNAHAGQVIALRNVSATAKMRLRHEHASGTAAWRLHLEAAEDITVGPRGVVLLWYDEETTRWTTFRREYLDAANTWSDSNDFTSSLTSGADLYLDGVISPAQITSNQNDYAPTGVGTANTLRLSTDASRTLTGLSAPVADGRLLVVHNVGSFSLVLANDSSSSAAANRFLLGADITLAASQSCLLRYDGTSSRWRCVGVWGGAGEVALSHDTEVLSGTYTVTNAYASAGLSVTLTEGGDYLITADVNGNLTTGAAAVGRIMVRLYNQTAAAAVANSDRTVVFVPGASSNGQATAPLTWVVEDAAAGDVIRLEAKYIASAVPTVAQIVAGGTTLGETTMSFVRLQAAGAGGGGGGSGTVTSVSVVSANGLAGSVANATTTPAITISTTVTGILKGNGTAISAAAIGTGLSYDGTTLACTVSGVSDGDKGDITVSGSGAVWEIDPNAVGDAELRQSAGLSLVGRSANSAGNVADITSTQDNQVMRRSGTSVGWGPIDLSSVNAATGRLGNANGGVPVGAIAMFATVPSEWLECDGSAVSRTTYSSLFAVLGTTFGSGDGSTTFNLPDFRSRSPMGAGTGSGLTARTVGGTAGTETHTLTTAQIPAHSHGAGGGGNLVASNAAGGAALAAGTGYQQEATTASAGGGGSHNNVHPILGIRFCIKT